MPFLIALGIVALLSGRCMERRNRLRLSDMSTMRRFAGLGNLGRKIDMPLSNGCCCAASDIVRHSYGCYHLAKHRNAALTAEQMDHKNARRLYAHYRRS